MRLTQEDIYTMGMNYNLSKIHCGDILYVPTQRPWWQFWRKSHLPWRVKAVFRPPINGSHVWLQEYKG